MQGRFLLQLSGTSGAGKSSLARVLADHTGAVVFDYDVIKSAALDAGSNWELAGAIGYGASHALARAALSRGCSVILDSPCRFPALVDQGQAAAQAHDATYVFIECVLEDEAELRRRMRARARQRSQRPAFDAPPPDAPGDVMADAAGIVRIPKTAHPETPWLRLDMSLRLEACADLALSHLRERLDR